ncbi:hypothetical protein GW17_00059065 [Ensete ventricosum]|nr:hypothetical protein GW17_00059065 [Ensete ventricosum]
MENLTVAAHAALASSPPAGSFLPARGDRLPTRERIRGNVAKKKKRRRRSTSRRPSNDSARGVAREPSSPVLL